ncbi:DUF952 domain-containing protein [Paenibacillus albiflavus]|uniref:DUF952 domain-containing protein n=1 Tax=Paenibacillus albiflavus TaxID=2545760 RepID=A0A4R4EN20_9BACL|nr:DUF952 domain-containing protein [Paenibacillus albiflavus]TCZ79901.1 DUF952 domain-containing protein [Paenibacillus albiflavus]
MIYHIIERDTWKVVRTSSSYSPSSIEQEGFIHCSTREQVIPVANSLYLGKHNLLLLGIMEELVQSKVVYEDLYNLNQLYPHIYGALNLDAVSNIYQLQIDADGRFMDNFSEWDGN